MKVPHYKALDLIKLNKYNFFIIYGDNYGKISILINSIKAYFNKNEMLDVINFNLLQQENDNISSIDHELNSQSLFAKKKLIIVNDYYDNKKMQSMINLYNGNNIMILINYTISKIKTTLALQNQQILAISCYKNNRIQLEIKLKNLLTKYKLTLADTTITHDIITILLNDDLSMESEIKKLSTYKSDNRMISKNDIINVLCDNKNIELYKITKDLIDCNIKSFTEIDTCNNKMLTIRIIYNYFYNLINDDKEIIIAFKRILPIQYQEPFEKQTTLLKGNNFNIIKLLNILTKSEKLYKIHQNMYYFIINTIIGILRHKD